MATITQEMLISIEANTHALVQGLDIVVARFDKFDKEMKKVGESTSFLNRTLSVFVANIGVKLVGAATQAIGKFKQLFDQFTQFAEGATMQAARIEVQWRTLSLTAGNAGKSIGEMTEHVQALRAAGIKTSEAIEIVTQFLANELPVDNLTELARRAQDMAVVIGRDSTEAFSRFNTFLQTGNSEWIRTMGITKTANQMLEEYAQTQGKVVKALTERERKEALVQGLMKETMRYEGAYEEAMKDPYKRWTSLPRLISNVVEVLGATFVPLMGTVVDVFSDALEKIERLFRVTKKEAKETGQVIGTWKEGFLKLRAVVTAFANWFMSIWKRLTSDFGSKAEGMMDRFVNAIIRGVKAAAEALRKFATFIAGIFGGRAPGEITAEAIARTKPAPGPAAPARAAPPAAAPIEIMAEPQQAAKLREKPVAPPAAGDIARYQELTAGWAAMTRKLAQATELAAKARERLAKAEDWLEKASERVYDIRRKMSLLEIQWAEVPERFVRGRKRQLQMELMAAEHEEHERQKVVDAERERLQLAEEYERQVQQAADSMKREMDKLGESIAQQAEKYDEWLGKLQEAEQIRIEEPVQAVVNEFESLDDLTAGYLEEIEGELMPAFASIEESVLSIGSSLGAAWEKTKGFISDLLAGTGEWGEKLEPIKAIFQWLWDTIKKIYEKITEALEVYRQVKAIAEAAMPGGAAGAPMLAGEEESLYERFTSWLQKMRGEKPEVEETADETFYQPVVNVFNRLYEAIAGHSIVPELIASILSSFRQLASDVVGPLDEFTTTSITHFDRMATSWQMDIEKMTRGLDTMIGRFQLLSQALKGLTPMPESLKLAADGSFTVITVNLQGSQFGSGLDEWQVKDWMYESLASIFVK